MNAGVEVLCEMPQGTLPGLACICSARKRQGASGSAPNLPAGLQPSQGLEDICCGTECLLRGQPHKGCFF